MPTSQEPSIHFLFSQQEGQSSPSPAFVMVVVFRFLLSFFLSYLFSLNYFPFSFLFSCVAQRWMVHHPMFTYANKHRWIGISKTVASLDLVLGVPIFLPPESGLGSLP